MKHTSFSGTISLSPEVLKWFQDSMTEFEREKEKALRLFFLMRFGIPLRCAEGDKKICHYEYGDYSEYSFNGIVFAIEDHSQEYSSFCNEQGGSMGVVVEYANERV